MDSIAFVEQVVDAGCELPATVKRELRAKSYSPPTWRAIRVNSDIANVASAETVLLAGRHEPRFNFQALTVSKLRRNSTLKRRHPICRLHDTCQVLFSPSVVNSSF